MTFAPVFYGLGCGVYPEKPQGSWHNHSYQMIGMFKKDWELIGGELESNKKVLLYSNKGLTNVLYFFLFRKEMRYSTIYQLLEFFLGMDEGVKDELASWDLVDRILSNGLHVARVKSPNLFRLFNPESRD